MSNDITLEEYKRGKDKYKMVKYHILVLLLLIIGIGFMIFAGKFGSNALPFVIFTIFLSIPLLVVFRDKIPDFLPLPIRKFLVEDIEAPQPKMNIKRKFITTKTKQKYLAVIMFILIIPIIGLIRSAFSDLQDNMSPEISRNNGTLFKILAGIVVSSILGILVLNFGEMKLKIN